MKTTYNSKFYRFPWNKENVEHLIKWWPHFGTPTLSHELDISAKTIKNKVNKLYLMLLPKSIRICVTCRNSVQYKCYIQCHDCYCQKRRNINTKIRGHEPRFKSPDPNLRWISGYSNRAQKQITNNSINYEFMYNLWQKQSGKCYYSGLSMQHPKKGTQRTMYSASIDRIDNTKGYTKDNVVWCCWFYNHAKNKLPQDEFINLCSLVKSHLKI